MNVRGARMQKLIITGIISSLFLMTSCGKLSQRVVSDVTVATKMEENNQWISTDFKLDLGERKLPSMTLPLPRDYGKFRSYKVNKENYIGLDFNMSSILNLPGGVATLPNGEIVPIGLSGKVTIIEVPISRINGKAYIAVSEGVALVGLAAAIKLPKSIDEGVVSEFPTYKVGKVDIMAGFFTSSIENANGFAIFANLGKIWDGQGSEYASDQFVFEPTYVAESKRLRVFAKLKAALENKVQVEFANR